MTKPARLPLSMMHQVLLQEAELQRLKLQQQQGSATAAQPPPIDNSKVRLAGVRCKRTQLLQIDLTLSQSSLSTGTVSNAPDPVGQYPGAKPIWYMLYFSPQSLLCRTGGG